MVRSTFPNFQLPSRLRLAAAIAVTAGTIGPACGAELRYSIQTDQVVLRPKDGIEITVPVSQLSKADQAIVGELKKSGGAKNPFD